MLSLAAAQLGHSTHIFCPEDRSPASCVAACTTVAAYDDTEALLAFADSVDVVTLEFENIPVAALDVLADRVAVHPGAMALSIAQDRMAEKHFLNTMGAQTAPYRAANSLAEAQEAVSDLTVPCVMKTRRFGYDGKGQVIVRALTDVADAWEKLGGHDIIIEGFVAFEREISVLAARNPDGQIVTYAPVENRHKNHILDVTIAPANISPELAEQAQELGRNIIEALDYVGVLAVEMFVCEHSPRLLINEIAPRVHNSGHWTIEGAVTCQFEQHIRAVCNLPLGSTDRYCDAVMTNLIGDDIDRWRDILAEDGAHFHDYGKREARADRKMGHVTRLYPKGKNPLATG